MNDEEYRQAIIDKINELTKELFVLNESSANDPSETTKIEILEKANDLRKLWVDFILEAYKDDRNGMMLVSPLKDCNGKHGIRIYHPKHGWGCVEIETKVHYQSRGKNND